MTLVALPILVGLGSWQMSRKAWKEGLIAQLEARARSAPVALEDAVRRHAAGEEIEYLKVRAAGEFRHDQERYLYSPGASGPGVHVYTPLQVPGERVVLVNRGFVPDALIERANRVESLASGTVTVTGVVRMPVAAGWFVPAPDLKRGIFFHPDPEAMLGTSAAKALPFVIDADATPNPGGWPKGGVTNVKLPNRHLEYALTWFGLAFALVVIFLVYARGRLGGAPDKA